MNCQMKGKLDRTRKKFHDVIEGHVDGKYRRRIQMLGDLKGESRKILVYEGRPTIYSEEDTKTPRILFYYYYYNSKIFIKVLEAGTWALRKKEEKLELLK